MYFQKYFQYSFNIVQYRFDSEMLPYCFVVYTKNIEIYLNYLFWFWKGL